MPFSIEFLDEPLEYLEDDPQIPSAPALLTIGDFREDFACSLYAWSKEQYENQWREAIRTVLEENRKAALIVQYYPPPNGSNIEWWPMYREGETVYFQNQILMYSWLPKPFLIHDPFASLGERKTENSDGQVLSEWSVSLAEVQHFGKKIGI